MKNRNIHFDVVRTFAILCVVLCHCVETIYQLNLNGFNLLSLQSKLFMIGGFTIGRLGVPLFLFLTGSLVLSKEFNSDFDVLKFYKNNLLKLLIAYEICVGLYCLFTYYTTGTFGTIESVLKQIFLFQQPPMSNMWYFPMILEMYICLPFLSCIVHKFNANIFKLAFIILLFNAFVFPTLNTCFTLFGINLSLKSLLQYAFLSSPYVVCVLLGYYSNKIKLTRWTSLFFVAFGYLNLVALQFFMYKKGVAYNVWYNNFLLLICAFGIFKFIQSIELKSNIIIKVTNYISLYSLGMFFIHPIVYKLFKPYVVQLSIIMPLKVILLFVITIFFGFLIIYVLSKIKFIKQYFFLVK